MKLFGKKVNDVVHANEDRRIKVLGTCCRKCNTLHNNTMQALQQLNIEEQVAYIGDYATIAGYGVMSTPALVVDEKVILVGRSAEVEELKVLLAKEFINE